MLPPRPRERRHIEAGRRRHTEAEARRQLLWRAEIARKWQAAKDAAYWRKQASFGATVSTTNHTLEGGGEFARITGCNGEILGIIKHDGTYVDVAGDLRRARERLDEGR